MPDLTLLAPELALIAAAFLVFIADLLLPKGRNELRPYGWLPVLAAIGVVLTLGVVFASVGRRGDLFGVYAVDAYAHLFKIVFLLTTLLVIGLSVDFVRQHLRHPGEFYGLLLLATLGMFVLSAATELLTAYLGLELMSFAFYVLVGFNKLNAKSNEAAIKYILLGAFSSAVLLYGVSYVYGTMGTTFFGAILTTLGSTFNLSTGFVFGLVLIAAGLGFKVAAVPFHQWAPDVYEGAPIPITAFLSVASKMAAFALFLRLFTEAFLPVQPIWQGVLIAMAIGSLVVGNLVALRQSNVIRLLAYSSISQVGYVLVGLVALVPPAASFAAAGLVFHLVGYVVTNLAAFGVAIAVYNADGRQGIADLAGLSRRAPYLALVMMVALFSLAGMPFFAGFFTKFYLFTAAVSAGQLWLVAFAIVNSFVSLYYYLQVIKQMYVYEPARAGGVPASPLLTGVLSICLAGIVWLGVYPAPVIHWIEGAVAPIFR